jgi:hypothetical protein
VKNSIHALARHVVPWRWQQDMWSTWRAGGGQRQREVTSFFNVTFNWPGFALREFD